MKKNKRKKLLWKLFQSYLIITILSLAIVALFTTRSLKQSYLMQISEDLRVRALLINKLIPETVSWENAGKINRICNDAGAGIETRITVILSNGVVIGDNKENYLDMDNHSDRPEIIEAMTGKTGMTSRYSFTLKKDLRYVAIPVVRNSTIIGAVRTSMSADSIASALKAIYLKIGVAASLIACVAAVVSFVVSRWINKPIDEMLVGAKHFSGGDLDFRISVSGIDELDTLAEGMNSTASQLNERVRTITEQRNEIEAVLAGMLEAVFAVDIDEYITEYNPASEKLFKIDRASARGKNIREVISNTPLLLFVNKALHRNELLEDEIVLYGEDERVLQVHGTQLIGVQGKRTGAVIVVNDITRLKKLENIRRDFVANVSHELKTPVTSIIGFVETLKDGAIKDTKNRKKFLKIILKQGNRLNNIIEDLLSLSRIENDAEKGDIDFERCDLREILSNSISLCERVAIDKGINITLECGEIFVACKSALLEQAVVNLIDNAVKYSENDTNVEVKALLSNENIVIDIKDTGCGIPEEHHSRIFERFYRIDKGRSRELGGTGLGLAIVKHIILAQNGRVVVESSPGKGSTFSIILPAD